MTDAGIIYRSVEKNDVPALHGLMRALAEHENSAAHLTVTPSRLEETGFGGAPQWRGFLAEVSGKAIGYATYTEGFHLWSGARRMLLDDIYVDPGYRGSGVGERLIAHRVAAEFDDDRFLVVPDHVGQSFGKDARLGERTDVGGVRRDFGLCRM